VTLSTEQSPSLRAELDALRGKYAAKIGERDAEYIRTVRAVARISRAAGRLLIHFSLEPVSWSAGVVALATGSQFASAMRRLVRFAVPDRSRARALGHQQQSASVTEGPLGGRVQRVTRARLEVSSP
jgi:hypothetical protein